MHVFREGTTPGAHNPSTSRRGLTALLALFAVSAGCGPATEAPEELDSSLYALVSTVDGVAFHPPLGPAPAPSSGVFDPTLLGTLRVALESTDASGRVATLATFDAASSPRLHVLPTFEVYFVNVPAAAYITDPSREYRFRALLGTAELGRSDLSSHVFTVLQKMPALMIGVKLRIESRPAPTLASLTPASAVAGSDDVVLTLDGAGFTSDSVVTFDGAALATSVVSTSRLTALAPAAMLTGVGRFQVSVTVPAPGGGTSAPFTFETTQPLNPQPVLSSLAPATPSADGANYLLTIQGSAFLPGAQASFDTTPVTTTFVSSTTLVASVPTVLFAASGTHVVTVANPAPSAGPSNGLTVSYGSVGDTGNVVRGGLALHYDAAISASAPAGSTTWYDLSGYGRNGVLTAGATFDTAHGGSVRLDGVDDFVFVPGGFSSLVRNSSTWTFSIWLSVRAFSPPYPVLFSIGSTPASNYYELFLETSASTSWMAVGGALQSTNLATSTNTVYNFTWVLSGSTGYLYRNGVRVATYSGMPRNSDIAGDLFIGRFKNPGYELAGNIYQVQVYTRALGAAEVTQNFDALRGRYGL